MKDSQDFFILFVIALFASIFFCLGYKQGQMSTREAAIKAGAAHWTINAQTGNKQFVFIKKD